MDHQVKTSKDDGLPPWFKRPESQSGLQASLFPEDVHDVLARLKISSDDLARWHQYGWVSFGTNTADHLEPAQIDELVFVRDVVRSGLSDALLKMLFEQLPKPLAADPDRIAFSFTYGWVLPTLTSEPDLDGYVEDNVDTWLEQLAEEGQIARLTELRDKIEELLASVDRESTT